MPMPGRLGIIFGIALLYTCLFLALGLARFRPRATQRGEPRDSLVDVGDACRIHTEHACLHCKWVLLADVRR